jgi:hypothetical protein
MNVVSKLALDAGMSPYVLIAYRNLIAAAFIAPVAYLLERCVTTIIFPLHAADRFGLGDSVSVKMHACTLTC